MQAVVLLMPDENREALQTLLLFLHDVAQKSSVNQVNLIRKILWKFNDFDIVNIFHMMSYTRFIINQDCSQCADAIIKMKNES